MANEVVWFSSDEAGAPTLNNVAGSLINVLDACLIDGFNSKSVTSIVVADEVATVTVSAHGYADQVVNLIAGASPSGLSGRKLITKTGANTFTFPAPGISDQTATGTITVKRAPLDWEKVFTGTNKAIYGRTDPAALAAMLRVDDDGTDAGFSSPLLRARVQAIESATDIDTYDGEVPNATAASYVQTGFAWEKGANSSTPKRWIIVGDSRMMYFFAETANTAFSSGSVLNFHCFGDLKSYRPDDPYAVAISGSRSDGANNEFLNGVFFDSGMVMRPYHGLGYIARLKPVGSINNDGIGDSNYPVFPSPVNNGVVVLKLLLQEENANYAHPIRGELPGVYFPYGNMRSSPLAYTLLDGVQGVPGSMMLILLGGGRSAQIFMDVTGPWF